MLQYLMKRNSLAFVKRMLSYTQGQEIKPNIREYFYYIDHQGMLFLDDSKMKNFTSCFKEKKFLQFFFKRIRSNKTGRYEDEFPYVSPCGRELNFIRCDDVPIVYTHIFLKDNAEHLSYGYAGDLMSVPFQPCKIYMLPLTGRVYHPAEEKYGSIGLVRSKLAIELSQYFEFENGEVSPPTHITWRNTRYSLNQNWLVECIDKLDVKIKGFQT